MVRCIPVSYTHLDVYKRQELIPSGETSSFRSDPYALSEFALSRKVPEYVGRAKTVRDWEKSRQEGESTVELVAAYEEVKQALGLSESVEDMAKSTAVSSMVYACLLYTSRCV